MTREAKLGTLVLDHKTQENLGVILGTLEGSKVHVVWLKGFEFRVSLERLETLVAIGFIDPEVLGSIIDRAEAEDVLLWSQESLDGLFRDLQGLSALKTT